MSHEYPGVSARFLHPVEADPVMAGNGSIGLEILEDLPEVAAVLVPFGGGGLGCGIASALRQSGSDAPVHPVEPRWIETAPGFVDRIGGNTVLEPMWPFVRELLAESLVASPDEIAAAVRFLAERARIVAERAGACPVAVALRGRMPGARAGGGRKLVAVVSGGNIELGVFRRILAGETPDSAR